MFCIQHLTSALKRHNSLRSCLDLDSEAGAAPTAGQVPGIHPGMCLGAGPAMTLMVAT